MGDINLDLSKEDRFRKITYGAGLAGAIATGVTAAALGVAATPLAAAGIIVAGGVATAVVLPAAATAAFGLLYTAAKTVAAVGSCLTPSGFKKQKFYAKNRNQSVITRIIGKGLKAGKEAGGMSLLMTAVLAGSSAKAVFYTPFVALKQAVGSLTSGKAEEKPAETTPAAPKAAAPKTKTQKKLGKTATENFKPAPKTANDDQAPKTAAKQTKKRSGPKK